ncbi:MAG: hypothetical protein JWM95_392 [Gemmatimonadetes bacterium]|nr:hypothetical protein [Gemmatimonadota bacterium]
MTNETRIVAKFLLDEADKPMAIEQDGRRHYMIELGVDNAPTGTYAVTYKLDESYRDPIRESTTPGRFAATLTSYGDYPVQAEVRTRQRVEPIVVNLSGALRRGYGENTNPAIAAALNDIEHA